MSITPRTVLKQAAGFFKDARRSIYEGAALLYKIEQEKLWEGAYSSFTEYVEEECQLSRGFASKLLQVWKYYAIEGGVLPQNLSGVDSDKLYFAMRLPSGTVEERLVKAREWNRGDLRAELSTTEDGDCQHPEESRIILCSKFGKRVG